MKQLRMFSNKNQLMQSELAVISSIYPPDSGGPATFTSSFSSFLHEKGIRTRVLSYCDGHSKRLKSPSGAIRLISRNINPVLRLLLMVFEIYKIAAKKIPVISNGCFIELALSTFIIPINFTVKIPGDIVWERASSAGLVSCSVHEFQSMKLPLKYKILRWLFTLSLKRSRLVIVPAPYLVELVSAWGIEKNKVILIYNGVDIETFKPLGLPKKYDVISVSRLVPVKNIEQTLRCCARLNLKLLVVGDGPLLVELKNLAAKLGSDVTFFGSADQSQLPVLYNESRIMVLNSSIEATSYSLLEARACGLPTIANTGTGATEIISNEIDGILCGNPTGFSLEPALKLLSENHDIAAKYGSSARRDAVQRFSRKSIFEQIFVHATSDI